MALAQNDERAHGSSSGLAQDLRALLGKLRHRLREEGHELSFARTEGMCPQSIAPVIRSPRWSLLGPAAGTSPKILSLGASRNL